MKKQFALLISIAVLLGCPVNVDNIPSQLSTLTYHSKPVSVFWKNAIIYFLLTDRFFNGNKSNDLQYNRKKDGAVLRSFDGGDIPGITKQIKEGYFDSLGVNAIWFTPVFDQITSHTDEGTGKTYAYHGYWTRDWTALDPNFGTEEELAAMIREAHSHGIRVLLDAVINHTGPVTPADPQWPDDWVRLGPKCDFQGFKGTVDCTLVENLPDIRTNSRDEVEIPPLLFEIWQQQNRLDQELSSISRFFDRTGYPKYPFYYIVKWLTDWVEKYGIDGFRVDTAKHTEGYVWAVLKKECEDALNRWREEHPDQVIHADPFFMVGEVYGYGISGGRNYDYGDQKVDFYDFGFESLINFEFKGDANRDYETVFQKYSDLLNSPELNTLTTVNYLSSHDDGSPFDGDRKKPLEAANKLLLSPGAVQLYYGDESARPLQVEGAVGDANLRSFMNWEDISTGETRKILRHYRKLGRFRSLHPSVGAGRHTLIQENPYLFKRTLEGQSNDMVLIGLDLPKGEKTIDVNGVFEDGSMLIDHYSGERIQIVDQNILMDTPFEIVLLAEVE